MTHIGATGPAPTHVSFNPIKLRSWWLNIDRDEQVISWAQTAVGQMAIHAAFLLLLFNPLMRTTHSGLVAVTLLACALYPTKRMMVFCGMGTLFFTLRPFQTHHAYVQFEQIWNGATSGLPLQVGLSAVALTFLCCLSLFLVGQRKRKLGVIGERPILSMSILVGALLALTLTPPFFRSSRIVGLGFADNLDRYFLPDLLRVAG